MKQARVILLMAAVLTTCMIIASCSSETSTTKDLTLIAYDSFTPPETAFDAFTQETGIEVHIALAGDAGEMVAKASLTSGNPEGDVMWGVDNTLISRANDNKIFVSDPTEVDYGYVCVNFDIAALGNTEPPLTLDDLVSSDYKGMLVVENPATSSTGLAFLLATVAAFGDSWPDYWQQLVANDVQVVDSWDEAYYTAFSRYGGDRPLVVSYSTSPPAEVIFADPPLAKGSPAPTGVASETCFKQIEYAGVLRGTKYSDQAQQLVDYLAGPTFQALLPESLFVYPANQDVALPQSFIDYAPEITSSFSIPSDEIAKNRQSWTEQWSAIVLK
ncbi:MAG: thiamine ABC transporter substrate-binding protein [Actinomycetes bacterium]